MSSNLAHPIVVWQRVPPPDFHMTLLWIRSLEIHTGHSLHLTLSELDNKELFGAYRSPLKA